MIQVHWNSCQPWFKQGAWNEFWKEGADSEGDTDWEAGALELVPSIGLAHSGNHPPPISRLQPSLPSLTSSWSISVLGKPSNVPQLTTCFSVCQECHGGCAHCHTDPNPDGKLCCRGWRWRSRAPDSRIPCSAAVHTVNLQHRDVSELEAG